MRTNYTTERSNLFQSTARYVFSVYQAHAVGCNPTEPRYQHGANLQTTRRPLWIVGPSIGRTLNTYTARGRGFRG